MMHPGNDHFDLFMRSCTWFPAAHLGRLIFGAVGVPPAGVPTIREGRGHRAVRTLTCHVVQHEVRRRHPKVRQMPRPTVAEDTILSR